MSRININQIMINKGCKQSLILRYRNERDHIIKRLNKKTGKMLFMLNGQFFKFYKVYNH